MEILQVNTGAIYDIDYKKAGEAHTLLLQKRAAGEYDESLEQRMIDLSMSLYKLKPEEALKLAKIQTTAFMARDAAESKNISKKERKASWQQAEKSMREYFRIIKDHLLTSYGICISPDKLAANEIAWWKLHHDKKYHEITDLLTKKYEMLYRLDNQQARNVACMEAEAIETYDLAKKSNSRESWRKVLDCNILACRALQDELKNKYC